MGSLSTSSFLLFFGFGFGRAIVADLPRLVVFSNAPSPCIVICWSGLTVASGRLARRIGWPVLILGCSVSCMLGLTRSRTAARQQRGTILRREHTPQQEQSSSLAGADWHVICASLHHLAFVGIRGRACKSG